MGYFRRRSHAGGGGVMDTVVKELNEELGLTIDRNDIEFLFTARQSKKTPAYNNNEFNDVFLIKLDLDISKIKIQKEELTEIKFVDYHELEKMVNDNNEKNFVQHPEEYKKLFEYLHKRLD